MNSTIASASPWVLYDSQIWDYVGDAFSNWFTGWCLDKEDLCVAKLCAFREKDRNFVAALVSAGLVDAAVIASRLPSVPDRYSVERALGWLASRQ